MTAVIPITLAGDNLGTRHRHLNSLVIEAAQNNISLKTIQDIAEVSPIDRLYKIDLASKQRNLHYVLENLKDADMLYVSRALKSKWLLEEQYRDVISPEYLEDVLYPTMLTTAVSKMKHWVYINIRDPLRCQEFYLHYCEKKFDMAMKFLRRCSNEFILQEVPKILHKLSPFYLKVLCEKCPQIAKIYYDSIENNTIVKTKYSKHQQNYYNSIKSVLKADGDLFLDITEKYFDRNQFNKLSSVATKHIINNHKSRFMNKTELYTAWLLDIKTLAQCLSSDECKEVILKFARAGYLYYLFSYKTVEPLIKRLRVEERSSFKKKVFVDKDVGEIVKEWPYPTPERPICDSSEPNFFDDQEHEPYEFEPIDEGGIEFLECSRGYNNIRCALRMETDCCRVKTQLDRLFDEYRFVGFDRVFYELRKKMATGSSAQNRQFMMLVLVSKTGGRTESVNELLQFLSTKHYNEPVQIRAAVVRSLVKRACAWRLPSDAWKALLEFGRGLGLDGSPSEATCREGLHAVVLRDLLESRDCDSAILVAFFKEFSSLADYTLLQEEKKCVASRLPLLILRAAKSECDPKLAVKRYVELLDTLSTYNVRADSFPEIISAIADFARLHHSEAEDLLRRLYDARIARRELFKENFIFVQSDASYVNALRHDPAVLDTDRFLKGISDKQLRPERYLRKLVIYFSESEGLAVRHLTAFEDKVASEPNKILARPLALLSGVTLEEKLKKLDVEPKASIGARLAAALRANAHLARPLFDIDAFGWRKAGAKAVANKVAVCSDIDVDRRVQELVKWRRTARTALVLAPRCGKEADIFASVAFLRPNGTLKVALSYYRRRGTCYDPRVWPVIEPVIEQIDLSIKPRERLMRNLIYAKTIPTAIKGSYCTALFNAVSKVSKMRALPVLCDIENHLLNVPEEFIENLLLEFVNNDLLPEKISKGDELAYKRTNMYLRILAKFLLMCKSEESQKRKLEVIVEPFFEKMVIVWNTLEDKKHFLESIDDFLLALRYTKVYMDSDYVCILPVLERVVTWMKRILPLDMWFEKYVHIHLSMLYYKAIRQCIKQSPEVFSEERKKSKETVEIVGRVFGNYIANDVGELRDKYFESIIELYRHGLLSYLDDYFQYSASRAVFVGAVLEGILKGRKKNEARLAMHIIKDKYYEFEKSCRDKLKDVIKEINDEETKFFFYNVFKSLQ